MGRMRRDLFYIFLWFEFFLATYVLKLDTYELRVALDNYGAGKINLRLSNPLRDPNN